MNKAEALKRLEEIKQKQAELEEIINAPERWQDELVQPDKEEFFYLISSQYGGLAVGWSSEGNRKPEHAFRTEEQAELMAKKTLLMWEMHQFAYVKNKGWEADWDNSTSKWGLYLCRGGEIRYNYCMYDNRLVFGIAVKSREIAEEMLSIFGERIEEIYNKQY